MRFPPRKRAVSGRLAPRMAEYMIAARNIYESGRRPSGLRQGAISRSGGAGTVGEISEAHQGTPRPSGSLVQGSAARHRSCSATLSSRISSTSRPSAEGSGRVEESRPMLRRARGEKPPPAPKFMPGDNRFYTEVGGGKGPARACPRKSRRRSFRKKRARSGRHSKPS